MIENTPRTYPKLKSFYWTLAGKLHHRDASRQAILPGGREVITPRAHGIDVSAWQEKWVYANTTGQIDFAVGKIGEGTWIDPNFSKLWVGGIDQLEIRGLYFYQRSGVSWELQANNFLKAAQALTPKVHFLNLDIEKINNTIDKTFLADSKRIFDRLVSEFGKVLAYWNQDVFNLLMDLSNRYYGGEYNNWLATAPEWYAQYYWTPDPNKDPTTPKGRVNPWKLWQYSANGDKRYGTPDLSVFNGPVEDMKKWLGIGEEVPPVQPPVTPPDSAARRNQVLDEVIAKVQGMKG